MDDAPPERTYAEVSAEMLKRRVTPEKLEELKKRRIPFEVGPLHELPERSPLPQIPSIGHRESLEP